MCAHCLFAPHCTRTTRITSAIDKYLQTYADKRHIEASDTVQDNYTHTLVLPAFDEPGDLLHNLLPSDASDVLVILLINAPDNLASDCSEIKRTESLLHAFVNRSNCPKVVSIDTERHIDVLVIDLVSAGKRVPHRKGVGAVRKLGADIALCLIHNQHVHSPWIFCTDADALLPEGYFQAPEVSDAVQGDVSAVVLPYRHFVDRGAGPHIADLSQHLSALEAASNLYELHMRYFVNRLAWSGSPYAYPALGSLMIVSASHYAMVRGFPSRTAAEDFYLLNKLAKVGLISCPILPLVQLQARCSTRVPFGTGPALVNILNSGERLTYAPQSFSLLKLFYRELTQLNVLPTTSRELWTVSFHDKPQAAMLLRILVEIGFEQFFTQQLKQCKTPGRLLRAVHEWFDAFRILKFLHAARDFGHADIPVLEALAEITQKPENRPHDYLAFLCNLEQSGQQYRGLGRYSEVFPT